MPNLYDLTDASQPQDASLPVEQPYSGANLGPLQADTVAPVGNTPVVVSGPQPDVVQALDTRPEPMADSVGSSTLGAIIDRLTGSNGQERYQLWPEKVVREALAAPHDAMEQGVLPAGLRREDYTDIPAPDMPTNDSTWLAQRLGIAPVAASPVDPLVAGAQATAALAGTGGLAGVEEGAGTALGSTPFLRPALKYGDKIYKAPVNGQHLDALPAHLAQDFQTKAMTGDDISHYNFGFMNHKGQFLDREKALDYAVKEGLVDPSAGRHGALTSTLLADSSKPGMAIEAMAKSKYPLAKPSDRWTNTLGQNDSLIQHMTPDEFLKQARPLKVDAESRETIDGLKQHIQEGKPLDPLELHANGKEDGRHRAIAAKELGIKQVPVLNFRPKEPFYSALEHNVNQISQAKMTGDQWLGTLANKPGVKPEEMDWTGVKDFLKEKGSQPVTKAELQEHLTNNKVELKEVNKGTGDLKAAADDLQKAVGNKVKIKGEDFYPDEVEMGLYNGALKPSDLPTHLQDKAKKLLDYKHQQENPTKYHSYQLPGGENYREMLLTLPSKSIVADKEAMESVAKLVHNKPYSELTKAQQENVERMAMVGNPASKAMDYRSSHWDEPNILAHVRMNDRVIDGKKSLHLEEIQSDWHQQGREKGYKGSIPTDQEIKDFFKLKEGANPADYREEMMEHPAIKGSKVPDAPFKKTWHELALKRMIREAAEKGYDRLSWTPGEAQAARYDLSKKLDTVRADPKPNGSFDLSGMKNKSLAFDQKNVPADKVADYVGKDIAEKLLKSEKNAYGMHELSGLDLKVGGEGMKGFYDQIIPKALSKISGEKVKVANLPLKSGGDYKSIIKELGYTSDEWQALSPEKRSEEFAKSKHSQPIHYIDIPQALKDKAMQKGFPLFSGNYMYTPVAGNPFKNEKKK